MKNNKSFYITDDKLAVFEEAEIIFKGKKKISQVIIEGVEYMLEKEKRIRKVSRDIEERIKTIEDILGL